MNLRARTLTLNAPYGLANRLRMLISGQVIAEESKREFTLYWPPTRHCGCAFEELFQNAWHVKSEPPPADHRLVNLGERKWREFPDLLASSEPHLAITHYDWLLQPALYPYHAQHFPRCIELFFQLEPIPAIQTQVHEFRERFFRTPMIGVHLRRGDLGAAHPDAMNNTKVAMRAVEQFLARAPDAKIFLCTDDGAIHPLTRGPTRRENIHEKFVKRFGARVLLPQTRSLDRNARQAIQDALLELWLLRQTDFFVGTTLSSFSELVVFGRNIPSVMTRQPRTLYAPVDHFLRWTRLQPALERFSISRFGHNFPLTSLWFYYRRWVARQIKQRWRAKREP